MAEAQRLARPRLEVAQEEAPPSQLRGRGLELRNIAALLGGQGVTWMLSFLLMLYLPRFLGAANLGKLTFATSIAEMAREFVLLGTSTFLVREIARDKQRLASYLGHAVLLRAAASILAVAATIGLVYFWRLPEDKARVLYLLMGGALIALMRQGFTSVLQATEHLKAVAVANIAEKATITLLVVGLLLSGYGVVPVAAAMAFGAVVNLALCVTVVLRRHSLRFKVDPRLFSVLLAGGLPFLTFNLLRGIYAWVDVPMVGMLIGQEQADPVLGWYGAALRLWHTCGFLPTIVVMALLPSLARDYHQDRRRYLSGAQKSLQLVAVASVPITIACVMLGQPMIAFLRYGEEFRQAAPVLQVLGVGTLFNYTAIVMGTLLIAADRQREMCWVAAIALGFNVISNLIVIPWTQGLLGNAAVGAALTTVLTEVVCVVAFARLLPSGVLTGRLISQAVRAQVAGVALVGVFWFGAGLQVLLLLGLGCMVYGLAVVGLQAVSVSDLREVAAAFKRGRKEEPSP